MAKQTNNTVQPIGVTSTGKPVFFHLHTVDCPQTWNDQDFIDAAEIFSAYALKCDNRESKRTARQKASEFLSASSELL